jgi:hypothetical protein
LIRKGSGRVVGAATLVDSLPPLTRQQMVESVERHRIPASLIESGSVDAWIHPWVLKDVVRVDPPIPYHHPAGAVVWVTLGGGESVGPITNLTPDAPNYVEADAARGGVAPVGEEDATVEPVIQTERSKRPASRLTCDAEELLARHFTRIREPSLYIAGFRTSRGRELAIERIRQQPRIWAEVAPAGLSGMRVVNVQNPGQPYAAGQPRNSNLRSQAPKLSMAHAATYLEFDDIAAVKSFVDWYQGA